jgi:predicted aspartyl protease
MGRILVDFEVANDEDVVEAKHGHIPAERVRRTRLQGVVDTGATRLALPESVVQALGLTETGRVGVRFADGRCDERAIVEHVRVELAGRSSVFNAIVEPGRTDALIGAIVLEDLDLIPDCTRQALVPRDPRGIFSEMD